MRAENGKSPRFRRPSGAMVVAVIALVLAVAGTGIAGPGKGLPGKNQVESSDIDNGSVAKKDQELSQQTAWAVVRSDGAVTQGSPKGSDAVQVQRAGSADDVWYFVTFPGSVASRPISITPRGPDGAEGHFEQLYDVKGRPVYVTHSLCGDPFVGCLPGLEDDRTVRVELHADTRNRQPYEPSVSHGFVIVVLPK